MRWIIIGTVPRRDFELTEGLCRFHDGLLCIGDRRITVARGTPALLATACLASSFLAIEPPQALLIGDIGRGDGSRRLYGYLDERIAELDAELLVFHYLQPDVDWHNRIFLKIEELDSPPLLFADAGYMYVAKMSGFASRYDLFTPDAGEMAFLADEAAPHPFYTRGFLLQEEDRVPELIARAYAHENAARHLLVKGACDHVVHDGLIVDTICEPCVEAMEPIGGTGDSLTGLVSALAAGGYPVARACSVAARANRLMGLVARPDPSFSIADLLPSLPEALRRAVSG